MSVSNSLEKMIIVIIVIVASSYSLYLGVGFCLFFIVISLTISSTFHLTEGFVFQNTIPRIIIQTWKNEMIPEKYKDLVESVKTKNPTFEYNFFTDSDIEVFLKDNYPHYYDTYTKLPIKIQKIDFFRYVAIYHYGGFYLDLDMMMLEPFDNEILHNDCVFPVDEIINTEMCSQDRYKFFCKNNMNFLLGQYAFGAKPRNPFIKQLIDSIHRNIDKTVAVFSQIQGRNVGMNKNTEFFVYSTTGPDFVSNEYMLFSDKKSVKILDNNTRQFFGKYAQHRYFGTWK